MSSPGAASSLRQYDRLPDRLRLHRQADPRAIVVVEGESDRRLIRDVIGDAIAAVFVGGTRSEVLSVASTLPAMGMDRIACLVDRDFDDVVEDALDSDLPVVPYDGADLEDMLMWSPAARRAIEELGSDAKLAAFGMSALLDRVRAEAAPVARIRRANVVNDWRLAFDSIDLRSKVDVATLDLNVVAFCMALAASTEKSLTALDLVESAMTGEQVACPRTRRPLLRGRDQLAFVGVALRRLVGSRSKPQTDPELLAGVLRSSASREWMRSTEWYATVSALGQFG